MTASAPGGLSPDQQTLRAQLQAAPPPYSLAYPGVPYLDPPKQTAVEPNGDQYERAGADRKLSEALKRTKSLLWQMERAGGQKLADDSRRKLAEYLDGLNRELAGDVYDAQQGKAARMAADRARRAKANHVPSAVVRAWVEGETEPDLFGGSSQELYDLFVESCRRKQIGVNKIPSLHSWGRALTELGYPSVQKRQGSKVQKWRAMRPRSDG